jgi:hypothetical protein
MAKSRPSKAEAATAHHEAGHAVVGFREGSAGQLLSVSIVPDPASGTLGHVRRGKFRRVRDVEPGEDGKPRYFYRDFDPSIDSARLSEQRLKPMIIAAFAGVIAEKRFSGRGHNWVGADRDLRWASQLVDYLVGSARQAQKYSDYLWVVAEDFVELHWTQIDELANELLARKTMSGPATRAFLQAGTASERKQIERLTP